MSNIRLPEYTLRYHKSQVSVLQFVRLGSEHYLPILVSGDASGQLVLWDVLTRRPLKAFTIKGGAEIVALQYLNGYMFAVLTKDYCLRIFAMQEEESSPTKTQQNRKKEQGLDNLQECFSVPVNTLNFANFLIQRLNDSAYRLVCCSTQDSAAIDIYTFHLHDLRSLKRTHKAVNFYEAVQGILPHTNLTKTNNFGLIMRFTEHNGVFCCGFESGYVIGFKIHTKLDLLNSELGKNQRLNDVIELVYISAVHYPNPVLDLVSGEEYLLSSSVDNAIGTHMLPSDTYCEVYDQADYIFEANHGILRKTCLHHQSEDFIAASVSQISHLMNINNDIFLSSWSGETAVMNLITGETVSVYFRSKSNVSVNESPQGNLQNVYEDSNKDKPFYRVCSLTGLGKSLKLINEQETQFAKLNLGEQRRISKFLHETWCVMGYDDGCITFYKV